MPLHLFNTLKRRKELFVPLRPPQVSLYTCGPTVYDLAHIGNLRTYLFEDVLCRSLRFQQLQVQHVMNITDVDDKTLRGAVSAQKPLGDFTAPFKAAFFEHLTALNITPATHYPEATAFIPEMIAMIKTLIETGCAYVGADQSVYFSIEKFPAYGQLSGLADEVKVGASGRVQGDEYDKRQASDFTLWKAHDPERDGRAAWQSPWGSGRPGWHIECSALVHRFLGETIDIHAGGVDNIFPHHENEIAQSESCHRRPLARFWLHSEHLRVEGRKMAKSEQNFFTLNDLRARGFDPLAFRLLLLQTHYRTPLNFTWKALEGAQAALRRLRELLNRLRERAGGQESSEVPQERHVVAFWQFIADDLNTSGALGVIFDWARQLNRQLDAEQLEVVQARSALATLRRFDEIIGCLFGPLEQVDEKIPQEIFNLLQRRQDARSLGDWNYSDLLREEIGSLGYIVEDFPDGPRLRPKLKNSP